MPFAIIYLSGKGLRLSWLELTLDKKLLKVCVNSFTSVHAKATLSHKKKIIYSDHMASTV